MRLLTLVLLVCATGLGRPSTLAKPPSVSIAAAANLVYVLDALDAAFAQSAPGVSVTLTSGASGSLFAQIAHGAPFDVFLSADTEYPHRAVAAGTAERSTLRTFATGRLVFWTTRTDVDVTDLAATLRSSKVRKIALAQPKLAPYGRAAQAALMKLGLWSLVRPTIVVGESISQTAQFIDTGHADAGFVALSVVLSPQLAGRGRWHEVDPALHSRVSLDHAAVLTTRGAKNPAAHAYLEFLGTETAKSILRDFGYHVR